MTSRARVGTGRSARNGRMSVMCSSRSWLCCPFSGTLRGLQRLPGRSARLLRGSSHGLADQLPGLLCVAPATHFHPLTGLQILVVLEKVLHLLQRDARQVGVVGDVLVALGELRGRDGEDLPVPPLLIPHLHHT